jgi:putative SOS response-associated peptidase YedK
MLACRFYESVDRDGKAVELEFVPRTQEPLLVPCLWAYDERDQLYSFAAITDDPEPEDAEAGHDRTIIDIKPEYVDAWLNPAGDLKKMQAIFDDRQHPYYEHREAMYRASESNFP